nr:hypothetical protein [Halomonas sp. 18071143]
MLFYQYAVNSNHPPNPNHTPPQDFHIVHILRLDHFRLVMVVIANQIQRPARQSLYPLNPPLTSSKNTPSYFGSRLLRSTSTQSPSAKVPSIESLHVDEPFLQRKLAHVRERCGLNYIVFDI